MAEIMSSAACKRHDLLLYRAFMCPVAVWCLISNCWWGVYRWCIECQDDWNAWKEVWVAVGVGIAAYANPAYHLSYPCPAYTPSLLPMPNQIPHLLPMPSQNTISTTRFQLEVHICPCPVSPSSSQAISHLHTISTIHVQTVRHLYSPCPISISYLQPMSNLYCTSTIHVQTISISTVHVQTPSHLSSPCPSLRSKLNQFIWHPNQQSFLTPI